MRRRQRGFAVVMAVLVAGSVTGIATELASDAVAAMDHLEALAGARAAAGAASGAIALALAGIRADDDRVDHRGEAWARTLPAFESDGASAHAVTEDEQALLNLNNIVDANGVRDADMQAFRRLLAQQGLPASLADALADWLDADDDVTRPGGAETAHYLARPRPYRAANRPLGEVAELLLVKGFDAHAVRRLAPHVAALPPGTRVNVNTASPAVLSAVLPGLSARDLAQLVASRDREPFASAGDFTRRLPPEAAQAANALLDVRSRFFRVSVRTQTKRSTTVLRAVITRDGPAVTAYMRDAG